MVIQHKKISDLKIYVEFREHKKYYDHNPFPTPFIEETLENIIKNEVYSFTNGFSKYHQVQITK